MPTRPTRETDRLELEYLSQELDNEVAYLLANLRRSDRATYNHIVDLAKDIAVLKRRFKEIGEITHVSR